MKRSPKKARSKNAAIMKKIPVEGLEVVAPSLGENVDGLKFICEKGNPCTSAIGKKLIVNVKALLAHKGLQTGGKLSKRTLNPGILEALKLKLKEHPDWTNLEIWLSFPRTDWDEPFPVQTKKGSFELSVDVPDGREKNPEATRIDWYCEDTEQRGSITFETVVKKYFPIVRQKLEPTSR